MENKCKCGGNCDCVSREKYIKALKATAYLANKVKVVEEKYKLALFSPEEKTVEEQVKGWGKKSYGESNNLLKQIKVEMVNDLPPGTTIKKIVLEDKDIAIDDTCEACGA
jgi:hypothetical protein